MFVLMHLFMPIGKGTKTECEQFMAKLIANGNEAKHFMVISLAEYESL